jgi:ankyrin repeat protein
MKNPGLIIDFFHKGLDLEMSLNQENWRLIHVASQTGNKDLAKFLLLKKVDINTRESSQNWTPLMVAVFNNQPEIVKLLISSKADQSLVDKDGMTALAYALQFNNRNIFKILNSKSLFYT